MTNPSDGDAGSTPDTKAEYIAKQLLLDKISMMAEIMVMKAVEGGTQENYDDFIENIIDSDVLLVLSKGRAVAAADAIGLPTPFPPEVDSLLKLVFFDAFALGYHWHTEKDA